MASVAVRRLRLTTPPGHGAAGRQRIEDALRLAAPDETRLLILRRLDLGRMPARAPGPGWAARLDSVLRDQRARAVHALHPDAASADAVWFRSTEEMRTLLLLRLASGQKADAWFWRLAAPADVAAPLGRCLARWAEEAGRDEPTALALARAVVAAAQAGLLPAIAAALPSAPGPDAHARLAGPEPASSTAEAPPGIAAEPARKLLARLDQRVARALEAVIRVLPEDADAAPWIARMVLLAAAPELVGHRASLAGLAAALVAQLRRPPPAQHPAARQDQQPRPGLADAGVPVAQGREAHAAPPGPVASANVAAMPPRGMPSAPIVPTAAPDAEQASRAAGVLLAIRALDRLGLGARIAADANAALAGFGRALLCHIAARARVPADDPLFAILDAPDAASHDTALHAWRRGLDRWLRRLAGIRLAEVAARRGWLLPADAQLLVRLPANAADIRLRRFALDVDPGFVPWLGLSVRYRYGDAPSR